MRFKQFLEERQSVREFQDKNIESEILTRLMELAKEIEQTNGNGNIEFVLYENGIEIYKALKNSGGYTGVMIESPHYIGIQFKKSNKENLVKTGYCMESLISRANQLGLGTCWISLNDVSTENKKILGATEENKIDYITAIGYPKKKSLFEHLATSSRLSIEDIVYMKEWGNKVRIEELDMRGLSDIFYYARYAPSAKNNQPWRFIVENNQVKLSVVNPEKLSNYIDAGIIAYYFQGVAHDAGIGNSWTFNDTIDADSNETYAVIGSFEI